MDLPALSWWIFRSVVFESLNVSTPETTISDLVEAPGQGAGLGNVANVIGELVLDDRLKPRLLPDVAKQYPMAVVQRVGWMIEQDVVLSRMIVEFD